MDSDQTQAPQGPQPAADPADDSLKNQIAELESSRIRDNRESQLGTAQPDAPVETPQPEQPVAPTPPAEAPEPTPPAEAPVQAPATTEPDGTGIEQPTQTPEERAAERDTQREDAQRAHNERSGGGEVRPGEIGEQRQEHNERTVGQ